jgi:ABC-type nitrate/sulfonate/bicarbonate transport system substrate-binding protein
MTLTVRAAEAPAHVDIALGDVSINKVPFIIAADQGIYTKNGLDVHLFITPSAAKVIAGDGIIVPKEYIGEAGAKAPVSIGGGAAMVSGVSKGRDRRVVISTTETMVRDHIISRNDIQTEQALKGKTLGAGVGNVPAYAATVYLHHVGLDKDVTVSKDNDFEALKTGKVDAFMGNLFSASRAKEQGFKDLVDLSKYKLPEAGSGIMVDPEWLAANRETAARLVKAAVEGTAIMKKDKKVFAATLAKWFNVTDPVMIDRLFAMAQGFPEKPYPQVEGLKMAMQVFDTPELRNAKVEDFYDSTFVAALDKSGYLNKLRK